jgi:hypothetical protein
MAWIKRNLLFVIGGAVAVVLLGLGGFYTYSSWSHNAQSTEKLTEIYQTLQNLQMQKPAPGNDKINNTSIAREQIQAVQEWTAGARKYFTPVKRIPAGAVTSEAFASALRRTIDLLQREADTGSVTLPPKYDFSFSAQRPLVKFAAGSLEPLATQLGEVKAISEILFSTRINALDSIQRLRISDDDLKGPQGDYLDGQPVTNDLAVITPYVVTFRCFTPELAAVLCAFANSSNAFLIKSINVQPASTATATTAYPGAPGMGYGEVAPPPGVVPGAYPPGMGYPYAQPGMAPAQPAATSVRGGLPTVLKEQLLRVTMEVDFVNLLPKTKS